MTKAFQMSFFFLALLGSIVSTAAHAQTSRQGFIFGLSLPGVGLMYNDDQGGVTAPAFSGGLRAGYGFSDQFQILAEGNFVIGLSSYSNDGGTGTAVETLNLVSHIFPIADVPIFLSPKIGIGYMLYSDDDDLLFGGGSSYGGGLGIGYEWRSKKHFALLPELRVDYYRHNSISAIFGGGVLNIQWYF